MIIQIFVWRSPKGRCYGNQLNLGDVCRHRQDRPLLFASAFDNVLANGKSAFKWWNGNHSSTSCTICRSFRCRDIAIFLIFKMAAAAISDFWNREILLANGVQRVETLQHAKFRQNRSIGCKYIKIFQFFKMTVVRHLGFVWGIFGPPQWVFGVSITLQNLVMIDAVVFIIPVWTFQYIARFAVKRLFMPPKLGFWGNLIP